METNYVENGDTRTASRETLIQTPAVQPLVQQSRIQSNLSYEWATNGSMFSSDVDRWISGDTGSHIHASMLPSGLGTSGRSTLATSTSIDSTGFWYVAALMLPLISISRRNWRCTPSTFLSTVELMLTQVAGYCGRARSRLRRFSREQGPRELFAGAMDIILVVYAVGFLLLSLYQASVFQQFG